MKWGKVWVDEVRGMPWEKEYIDYRALKKTVKTIKHYFDDENDKGTGNVDACNIFWSKVEWEVKKANAYADTLRGKLSWVGVLQGHNIENTQGSTCVEAEQLIKFVEINQTSLRKITKKALKTCPAAIGVVTPLEVEAAFPAGSASALGVCKALMGTEPSLQLSVRQIGAGQFAQVLELNGVFHVYLESGQAVREPMVVKVGAWRSQRHYSCEVELHKRAAGAGFSPRVFFESSSIEGTRPFLGVIAMERLNGPTLLKWLMWQTKKLHCAEAEEGKLPAWKRRENEQWAVDPRIAKLPLVREWNLEARRIRKALAAKHINHGDVHERNFVFDVPKAKLIQLADAEQTPDSFGWDSSASVSSMESPEAADEKRMKRWLMSEIAKGPLGSARLVIIDFGSASNMGTSRASQLFHYLFMDGRRLADPSEETRSPPTPRPQRRHAFPDKADMTYM
mmetsp:Transcript_14253/g.23736  ORF Transcript_14253/g.23736 Transcript_14253/m.23736 type:complete len:451 (-) Transcript_14253:243-1595(-)